MIRPKIKADRAKQFIPFDALKGLKEALREKEKIYCEKKELTDEEIKQLNQILLDVKKRDIVSAKYFANNEYLEIKGMVSSFEFALKEITIIKTKLKFDDLIELKIDKKHE